MLQGDIKEFSRHMQAADTGQAVWEALRAAVTEHAARCLWSEVSEGTPCWSCTTIPTR